MWEAIPQLVLRWTNRYPRSQGVVNPDSSCLKSSENQNKLYYGGAQITLDKFPIAGKENGWYSQLQKARKRTKDTETTDQLKGPKDIQASQDAMIHAINNIDVSKIYSCHVQFA